MTKLFPMKAVALLTRLSPHVIRIWEKRYQAVTPARSSTNRRLYTEADIERLQLLRRASEAGHSIGRIARSSREELMGLLARPSPFPEEDDSTSGEYLDAPDLSPFLDAVKEFDRAALEEGLNRAAVTLSRTQLIEQLLVPFMKRVGELWHEGSLRVAQEHLASSVVRAFLESLDRSSRLPLTAPVILVTTPAFQTHELGALMVAATAASLGWRVLYLGPDLPAEEICLAAEKNRARAVALSMVYPAGDPRLPQELLQLRNLLPQDVVIIVGGRACASYETVLAEIKAVVLPDLKALREFLESFSLETRYH